jgi:hypothetical protein
MQNLRNRRRTLKSKRQSFVFVIWVPAFAGMSGGNHGINSSG